ncbi:MAG: SAM-dependent methyltransferase [Hoeflea sp.]|uniref:class I SAM-dependent methyltransferase n=1 Tax=Hoeflea sp. TaxID=1940281 RepID=UPI001D2362FF|nr:SAM-dependent methyltransferase [Hoeflea sp.]MBU4530944.1 SAM-dependent methyltransferase [Alphaproteobacteria bacterium]MBU4542719.1 SAM-dependent methyltransferase [Alphaproteobacteria bacterium]MBU4549354.1 SAM-dependent methyltransferase [Alphaproteobacteria bacterium]MBV1722836.1 SAM-dependent methyltransferase [Hoeflea sp.]MBV1761558.1 SAM-dependent methyltransferase [Hoeflea sp.]
MNAPDRIEELLNALSDAFASGSLVRLKLGGYHGAEPELKSVEIKKIATKAGDRYSFTYKYKTRDTIKNFDEPEALALLGAGLATEFRSAQLSTTGFDMLFERNGEKMRLKRTEVEGREAPSTEHNRAKNRPLTETGKPWLAALGISGKNGAIRHDAQDKFRQINKMVEIFSPLIATIKAEPPLIVDMGAGKGYLDFALYDYLATVVNRPVRILGVEMREQLVNDGNATARASGFAGLSFQAGTIMDYDASGADAVIALHACDTATDDALFKGIGARAALIAVAPCCHKQIRRQMEAGQADHRLEPLLRHGIFLERQAEMATDTLRALLLELNGYRTRVFEFVSDAHTPKNNLIVAEKDGRQGRDRDAVLKQIAEIKSMFGIGEHYLEGLLGG